MSGRGWLTSSRVFLLLGIALVVLAFAAFPTKVELGDQTEPTHTEQYTIGWLFAPIIGAWGLASVALGLTQSSTPKRTVESCLLFITATALTGLGFAGYLAVAFGSGMVQSVGRGEPLFWVYLSLVLAPTIIIATSTFKYMKKKGAAPIFVGKKLRAAAFVGLAAVPLTYASALLSYLNFF